MKSRKIMATLLTAAMLLGGAAPVAHAAGQTPKLTIQCNEVTDKSGNVEVSLLATADAFQSGGVVLQYDATKLTPMNWQETAAPVDMTGAIGWDTAAAVGTVGDEMMSGKPALAYKNGNNGYLYLSANVLRLADVTNKVATTVRFKMATTTPPTAVNNYSVALAPKTVAAGALTAGIASMATGTTEYYYEPAADVGAGYVVLAAPTFTNVKQASVKGTTAAPAGDSVTVVCFDWDNTLLGSVTVPKGAPEADVLAKMDAFQKTLMSSASKDKDATKTPFFVDDKAYPLTNKRGYSFLKWLTYTSDKPTHCGRAIDGYNKPVVLPVPTGADAASFADLQSNIAVKACYQDNSELYYNESDLKGMQYTQTLSNSRVGTTATYEITTKLARQRTIDGVVKGAPRMVAPPIKATYSSGAGDLVNFFSVGNADTVAFSFYPSTAVKKAEAVAVDFYQASIKTNAGAKANAESQADKTAGSEMGFIQLGNIGLINEQLAANETTFLTAAVVRNGAGLTLSAGGITVDRVSLRTAWLAKNSVGGTVKPAEAQQGLTFDEMQHAINNNGALLP